MSVSLIVAAAENDVIGRAGALPWHLPEDLRRFRRLTMGHAVVAGRKTHESIVARLGHPLPGRVTVVVTRQRRSDEPTVRFRGDVGAALAEARAVCAGRDEVFIIGGVQIYAQSLHSVETIYLTRVHGTADGDAVMPMGWLTGFELAGEEPAAMGGCTFQTYSRR